ncbi:TPM domain-containing protein, partial [Bartonella taylorii]
MKPFRYSLQLNVFLYLFVLLSTLYLIIALRNITYAQPQFPPLTSYVNDLAHLLDNATKQDLTVKLTELEEKTGDQIVIITLPTLSGNDIETYSNSLFRKWALGQ